MGVPTGERDSDNTIPVIAKLDGSRAEQKKGKGRIDDPQPEGTGIRM
jgi:hypothetical protein